MSTSNLKRALAYAYDDVFLTHDLPSHPENADRLRAIWHGLELSGLLNKMLPLPVKPIEHSLLTSIHDQKYVHWLETTAKMPRQYIDVNTYTNANSYTAAVNAAGAAVACMEAIISGQTEAALALVRPPGHHAGRAASCGFCLLNNLACAAMNALNHGARRLLIFDFDVHHGNGTQEIFYAEPRVLFISLHQYPLFPHSGLIEERGQGAGAGLTVNIPLPPNTGDTTYSTCLHELLYPLAEYYRPEIILASAGFDGHWRDPLANWQLSMATYDLIIRSLHELAETYCQGRLLLTLEGGYDLAVLKTAIPRLAAILLHEPVPPDALGPSPNAAATVNLDMLQSIRAAFPR